LPLNEPSHSPWAFIANKAALCESVVIVFNCSSYRKRYAPQAVRGETVAAN
jgi:hypothetical protein